MSYEFQKTFDGSAVPLFKPSTSELVARVEIHEDDLPADIVRKMILIDPITDKLLRFDIPPALTYDAAYVAFCDWLWSINAFETFARTCRKHKDDNSAVIKPVPEWYSLYLETTYWGRVKHHCELQNRSCVLCNVSGGNMHIHHRTYATLGKEKEWDITLLCDRCHNNTHRFVGVRLPDECPPAVLAILQREFGYTPGVSA
jgi:hypothetical protein